MGTFFSNLMKLLCHFIERRIDQIDDMTDDADMMRQRRQLYVLGAICGSAISMDLPAQSVDP